MRKAVLKSFMTGCGACHTLIGVIDRLLETAKKGQFRCIQHRQCGSLWSKTTRSRTGRPIDLSPSYEIPHFFHTSLSFIGLDGLNSIHAVRDVVETYHR